MRTYIHLCTDIVVVTTCACLFLFFSERSPQHRSVAKDRELRSIPAGVGHHWHVV